MGLGSNEPTAIDNIINKLSYYILSKKTFVILLWIQVYWIKWMDIGIKLQVLTTDLLVSFFADITWQPPCSLLNSNIPNA